MTTNEVLQWLERRGSKRVVQGMARYGIPGDGAVGVAMGALLKLAKQLGTDQESLLALWQSGCYEARLLAALVGFQNWGDCDTVCFKLFDRVPFAFEKAPRWAKSPRELTSPKLRARLARRAAAAPRKIPRR